MNKLGYGNGLWILIQYALVIRLITTPYVFNEIKSL